MAVLNHSDDQEVAVERVKNELMKFHGSSHKLSSTVRRCLGYPYYVKKHTKAEDCVEVIKVNNNKTLSKDDLMDYIQKNYSKDVINGDKLWYGRIFAQPVSWNKKSEKHKQMVIMWVFRHCLADGISLIALVQKVLYRQNALENPKVDIKVPKPSLSLDDVHMNRNPFTCEQDEDTFNTEKGERQIAINSEDEINYVPLVKKIKSKLGVGFTEVLTACLTASLAEVLAKRGKTMDKYTMGLLFRPYDDDFVKIINGTYDYNNLSNNFTAFIIRVPVTMKQGSTMIDRIKAMDLEAKKAKTSVDALFNHTLTKYGHYIPHPIMKSTTMFMMRMSAVASNVGAMRDGTIAGYEVESGLSYLPYCYDTGIIIL
nr:uncharacterized protein LOC111429424 [Onthophagus taurus]